MQYLTYGEIRTKIEDDLDLEDETFIQPSELLGYVNDAIKEAEAEILGIYEDYFLSKGNVSLVSGTEEYTLPTGMYANKIRAIIYRNQSLIYEVKRLRHSKRFLLREITNLYPCNNGYQYMVLNSLGSVNPKLLLIPPAYETITDALVVWFIRNATLMVDDTSICDIPEFSDFVIQYAKCSCLKKEGHPNLDGELVERERLRKLMVDTLSNMIPDEDTLMEMDLSFYEEMS
jgi:hypothetical protein